MKVYVLHDSGEYSRFEVELFETLEAAQKWADAFTLKMSKDLGEPTPKLTWTKTTEEWTEHEEWSGWEEDDVPEHGKTQNWIIHLQEVRS